MSVAGAARNIIELFDPERHDRTGFRCGVEQVDNYFQRTAGKLARAENVRLYVLTTPTEEIVGFHSLNAHGVDYRDLPHAYARARPAHGQMPAVFISMIGVDARYAGRGYGSFLLLHALERIASAADDIGIAVVRLDVLDCGDPNTVARRLKLYTSYGFKPLPLQALRLYMPMATVRELVAEYSAGRAQI